MQNEVHPSHKLQDHAYEHMSNRILSDLSEDNPSQRHCQYQWNHPRLPHRKQECQESLIQ